VMWVNAACPEPPGGGQASPRRDLLEPEVREKWRKLFLAFFPSVIGALLLFMWAVCLHDPSFGHFALCFMGFWLGVELPFILRAGRAVGMEARHVVVLSVVVGILLWALWVVALFEPAAFPGRALFVVGALVLLLGPVRYLIAKRRHS